MTMNMAGTTNQATYHAALVNGKLNQGMMVNGNSAAINMNTSGMSLNNNEYKMKHNSSNQSIPSQKKAGISTIRKPAAGSLDNSFSHPAQNASKNQSSYKYMSPYSKNISKKGIIWINRY